MLKVCVFDLDGTVMDTLESIAYFVNFTMSEMGLPVIETEKFKYFAGDGRATLIHRSLEHNGADTPENFERAIKIYDRAYEGNSMHLTKPFDGIKDELEKIKTAGIKIAVLSNKPDNVAVNVIEDTFGKDYFVYVQGQRTDIPKKPDPAGFVNIANQLGVQTCECAMVGDTNVDMLTGINAGAHSVGVLWGFRPESELVENGAEVIVRKVSELAQTIISV